MKNRTRNMCSVLCYNRVENMCRGGGGVMLRIKKTQLKSVKRATMFVDTYFVSKFGFSPYRGCQHGCAYCDGRAERYYVEGIFDEDIEVRLNAAEILDTTLVKSREFGIVGIGSGGK